MAFPIFLPFSPLWGVLFARGTAGPPRGFLRHFCRGCRYSGASRVVAVVTGGARHSSCSMDHPPVLPSFREGFRPARPVGTWHYWFVLQVFVKWKGYLQHDSQSNIDVKVWNRYWTWEAEYHPGSNLRISFHRLQGQQLMMRRGCWWGWGWTRMVTLYGDHHVKRQIIYKWTIIIHFHFIFRITY